MGIKIANPATLISDNGRQYASNVFAVFLHTLNIKHVFTLVYNHMFNSVSERVNQVITLAINVNKGIDIETMETKIVRKINFIVNQNFKHSPYEILNNKSVLDHMQRSPIDK